MLVWCFIVRWLPEERRYGTDLHVFYVCKQNQLSPFWLTNVSNNSIEEKQTLVTMSLLSWDFFHASRNSDIFCFFASLQFKFFNTIMREDIFISIFILNCIFLYICILPLSVHYFSLHYQGGVCPFHYNHWSCDGMKGGGRDHEKATRCRCKVAFDLLNHMSYKPDVKKYVHHIQCECDVMWCDVMWCDFFCHSKLVILLFKSFLISFKHTFFFSLLNRAF